MAKPTLANSYLTDAEESKWLRGSLRSGASMLALGCLLASGVAHAQDESAAETEASDSETADDNVIIVRGIRAALQTAAERKRNADTVVDSITASDIATLPDLSVAEALGRIPGLTVSRFPTNGGASPDFPSAEGRGNLIRGLGFVRSEFNGRDAFSANGGRALDWSSIPPELVGAVDVYKNQSADLIEGGISGTINLRTLEPFDRSGRLVAGTFDMTYSDLRKSWSPSGSITLSDRWDAGDSEFGALVSYSRSLLDSRIHGWQQNAPQPRVLDANGNVPVVQGIGGAARYSEFDGVDPANIIGTTPGFQMRTNDSDRDRESYYGALQWKNSSLQATVKYVNVSNDIDSLEHTFEWWPEHDNSATMGITNMVIDPDFGTAGTPMCSGSGGFPQNPGDCETLIPIRGGLMESGFVTNEIDSWTGAYGAPVGGLGIGKQERTRTEDVSFNLKWNATDRLYAEFDAHYTKSSAKFMELWGGTNTYLNWQITQDLDHPMIEFFVDPRHSFNPGNTRDPNDSDSNRIPSPTGTADPNGTTYQFAADRWQVGEGDLYALKGDLRYDLSGGDGAAEWFKSVRFGARFAERSQVNSEMALNWGAISPAWAGGFGVVGTFDDPATGFETVDFSNFFRGGTVMGDNTSFVFVDRDLLMNYTDFRNYIDGESQLAGNHPWAPRGEADGTAFGNPLFRPEDTSDITEKTYDAYVRLDFEKVFDNGMSIDGNFGVRYAKSKVDSNGFIAFRPWNADAVQPTFGFDPDLCPENTGVDPCVRLRTDDAESRDDPRDFLPEAAAYGEQAPIAQTVSQSDDKWLPSFNMKLNLDSEMLVRFAYSKGLSRPNVQDLRASQEYVVTTNRINFPPITDENDPLYGVDRGAQDIRLGDIRVNRGNPYLKPTTAHSFDLSWEWYFDRASYVSVAGFYKDISNIITNGDMTLGSETLDGQDALIIYNGPVNQASAKIKGVEIAYQQFYDFLPGILSNLGFQANYTFIDASATPPPNGVDSDGDGVPDDVTTVFRWGVSDMLGQSKHLANAVAIYQDDALELRLAYNWRSKYLTTYRDWVTGNPVYNSPAGFLDASIKYRLNENVQLRASIANILDTKSKAKVMIDQSGQMYDRFSFLNDRRIVMGVYMEF